MSEDAFRDIRESELLTARRTRSFRLLGALAFIAVLAGSCFFFYTRPHYSWLVFGPEARLRVLLCDHGTSITMEHHVDGQPTSRIERFRNWEGCNNLAFKDPDGQTTYTISQIRNYVEAGKPVQIMAKVKIDGPLSYEQYCDLSMEACDPASAKAAHFNGPLTVGVATINWKVPEKLGLTRGDKPTSLRAFVGTMDASSGCWVVVSSHDENQKPRLPAGVHPEVEIEFPPKYADQPGFRQQYALDQVCCGATFYSPIRVPEQAGDGTAKVTFSFPSWTEVSVASTTLELPIVDALPEAHGDLTPNVTSSNR